MGALASATGLSRPAVYEYFPSTDAVIAHLEAKQADGSLAARAQAVLDEIDREAASKREAIATMFGSAKPETGKAAGRTRKASSGLMNTLKSGEGFVMEFTGPGAIHTQTRNPDFLVTWLTEVLPFTRA